MVAVVVVAVALAAAAVIVVTRSGHGGGQASWLPTTQNGTPPANLAVVDEGATSTVQQHVAAMLGAVFSYAPTNPGVTQQAVDQDLTGAAAGEYSTLNQLLANGSTQRIAVSTTVRTSAVITLTASQAQLLELLDQQTQDGNDTLAALLVSAVRTAGQWRISDFQAELTQHPLPDPAVPAVHVASVSSSATGDKVIPLNITVTAVHGQWLTGDLNQVTTG